MSITDKTKQKYLLLAKMGVVIGAIGLLVKLARIYDLCDGHITIDVVLSKYTIMWSGI